MIRFGDMRKGVRARPPESAPAQGHDLKDERPRGRRLSEDVVLFENRGKVGIVTLNRPAVRNAQNSAMTCVLDAALHKAAMDDTLRVIVLRGAGRRSRLGMTLEKRATRMSATREQRCGTAMRSELKSFTNGAESGSQSDHRRVV
jgi:hypothetical protein